MGKSGRAKGAGLAGMLAALLCAPDAKAAKTMAAPFLQLVRASEAPIGFVEMCRTDRTFCSSSQAQPAGDDALVTGALKTPPPSLPVATTAPALADAPPLAIPTEYRTVSLLGPAKAPPAVAPVFSVVPLALEPIASSAPAPDFALTVARADPPGFEISLLGGGWLPAVAAEAPMAQASPVATAEAAPQETPPPAADPALALAERQLLRRVNRYVNARVLQETDMQAFGEEELWRRSGVGTGAVGDCEDIAIEKRYELIGQGFPEDRLFFAVLFSHEAGLHTVLVARTREGDMVLDSRTGFVLPWNRTGYSWISVQSTTDPMAWYAIDAHGAET